MLDRFRGEIYLILGALFFSFNGVISTLVLDHMSPFRLVQIRCIGAFTILFLFIVARNRNSLRATRQEIPTLILFGVIGFAVVQAGYFLGIQRGVPLSLVLIIEFTAPIWIVLWIKSVRKRDVPNAMWGGIALSFLGLIFIAKVWDARLTSMLILTFIYLGHLFLLYSFEHFQKADFAASILAIIGMVNLPIVKFSVDWWTTLHQGRSVFRVDG